METETKLESKNKLSVPIAIIIVGVLVAGAVYFSSTAKPTNTTGTKDNGIPVTTATLAPIGVGDRTLGNPNAKVTLIMYEDFQCVFCGAISGFQPDLIQSLKQRDPTWTPFMPAVKDNYVKNGLVQFVYRDYAFLGPESIQSAEAARCAGDQGKFWEYHDYLFAHQGAENIGIFSNPNLESFAKNLNLDTTTFNKCLDANKYAQAVADSKTEGDTAGVTGTPKGFILKDGKIISTIDGAESLTTVKQKIDFALK